MKLKAFMAEAKEQRKRGAVHTGCGGAHGASLSALQQVHSVEAIRWAGACTRDLR